MSKADEASYQAPALTKGLEVLEYLSERVEAQTVSEIARALGKSRNEIYRMVIVLEQGGYLNRSDADRFGLTHKLFDLAMRSAPQKNLLQVALPVMQDLSQECFQSCHLMIVSGSDVVVVARIESPDVLGFAVRVGYRLPINEAAAGRVLYALQNETTRVAWRGRSGSRKDREQWTSFEHDAKEIVSTGFHLSPSRFVDAVTDIAAPITQGSGTTAIAALVMPYIGGRSARLSLTRAATATRDSARQISADLG
jgi:DNA-binding IclR family transcriptional regulator